MAQAAVSFCGSLTCLIEQPAGAGRDSLAARSGLHSPMWAPTHGPHSHAPRGQIPGRSVREERQITRGLITVPEIWWATWYSPFQLFNQIFYPFCRWGGWMVIESGMIHDLPLQGVTNVHVFVCMCAPATPSSLLPSQNNS